MEECFSTQPKWSPALNIAFLLRTPNTFHIWPLNPNWRPAGEGMGATRPAFPGSHPCKTWLDPVPLYDLPFWTLNPTNWSQRIRSSIYSWSHRNAPFGLPLLICHPLSPLPSIPTHMHTLCYSFLSPSLVRKQDVLWELNWKAPKSPRHFMMKQLSLVNVRPWIWWYLWPFFFFFISLPFSREIIHCHRQPRQASSLHSKLVLCGWEASCPLQPRVRAYLSRYQ